MTLVVRILCWTTYDTDGAYFLVDHVLHWWCVLCNGSRITLVVCILQGIIHVNAHTCHTCNTCMALVSNIL